MSSKDYPAPDTDEYPTPELEEFEQFREWVNNPHDYGRDWKDRHSDVDGRVVAFFCTYMPREVFYAADVMPVRVYGGHQSDEISESDEHIFRGMFCPFSRDLLSQGLLGRYDYADGIGMASTCLHLRQAYQSWEEHVLDEDDFSHYFLMPHGNQQEGGVEYLAEKLAETREAVEEFTGKEVTDEDLQDAIEVYDENRRLMREVYEYRKEPNPPISGLQAQEMVKASHVADPKEHNELLRSALEKLENYDGPRREAEFRLMHISSENDDRRFMHMVEENLPFNITVVTEEACVGTRDFWNVSDETGEGPLVDIANRYLDRPPCPNKDWPSRKRMDHIAELAEDFDIDGAMIIQQKFCDPHELDIPYEREMLEEEMDIQTLTLEFDASVPVGQFITRVEAFVEQLQTQQMGMDDLY
ncbi:MAG: benzoyl-CoA reductase subunit C [Haloarculaceae archaeon]|jgi:benzoyl-CoA reductase subunit C